MMLSDNLPNNLSTAFGSVGKSDNVHYKNPEYSNMSLHDLIQLCRDDTTRTTPFEDLVMVALMERGRHTNVRCRPYIDPYDIYQIVIIERNRMQQIYKLPNLQSSVHFSVPLDVATEIAHRIKMFHGSNGNAVKLKSTAVPNRIFNGTDRLPKIGAVITNAVTLENTRKKINAESIVTRLFQSGVLWRRDNEEVGTDC